MTNGWKSMVRGCFGVADKKFARHASDQECAFDLLKTLREQGIGWRELKQELHDFLDGATADHVAAEITHAKLMMKPWLLD